MLSKKTNLLQSFQVLILGLQLRKLALGNLHSCSLFPGNLGYFICFSLLKLLVGLKQVISFNLFLILLAKLLPFLLEFSLLQG